MYEHSQDKLFSRTTVFTALLPIKKSREIIQRLNFTYMVLSTLSSVNVHTLSFSIVIRFFKLRTVNPKTDSDTETNVFQVLCLMLKNLTLRFPPTLYFKTKKKKPFKKCGMFICTSQTNKF